MPTISSSHAEVLLVAVALTVACGSSGRNDVAPEAPRPLTASAVVDVKPPGPPSSADGPVEVAEATIHRATADPDLLKRFGRDPGRPDELLLIDVRTKRPLGDLSRSALPVILLNGRPILNTIALDQTRLVALIRAGEVRRAEATVAVDRLGDSTARSPTHVVVQVP